MNKNITWHLVGGAVKRRKNLIRSMVREYTAIVVLAMLLGHIIRLCVG